jgi:hypothetical protein
VSTLADLVRARTGLDEGDVDWLHRLVGEWQLVADLSFADLLLRVRTADGRLADGRAHAAHDRPDDLARTTWSGTEVPAAVGRRLRPGRRAGGCRAARSWSGRRRRASAPRRCRCAAGSRSSPC